MTTQSSAFLYAKDLFKKGIELFDYKSKTSTNLGGAQLFRLGGWKGNNSPIEFNNENFGNVLKELAATLYSLSRVAVDLEGNPIKIPNTNKNQRERSGLLLYTQYGEDGCMARDCVTRILEACPELEGYVAPVVDLLEDIPDLECLKQVRVPPFSEDVVQFMNPKKVIILNVPSGSKNSSQYWGYRNNRLVSRKALNDSNIHKADLGDLT